MRIPIILLLAFLWAPFLCRAQEDLRHDQLFFEQQSKLYQEWLDHVGLGQYLRVRELDIEEKELALYLEMPFSDTDTIITAWKQLKTTFESKSSLTLEEQLFYKATQLMEVRQSAFSVQLYDTYDLRVEPLFMRAIYFADNSVQIEENNPKSKNRDIYLAPMQVKDPGSAMLEEFRTRYSQERVYACINQYAQEIFEKQTCSGRQPKIQLLEQDKNLRFEVVDLCKVVLTDESNPLLCRWLNTFNKDCNWIKRELLTFTFVYQETPQGFKLDLILDGKVGSGLYSSVRRGGYLSMEVDFDDYLDRYADTFTIELHQMLKNCQ